MEPTVLMKLPGEKKSEFRRDSAVHAGEPQQPDRVDCRAERRVHYGDAPLSTTSPRPGWSTARLQIEARIDQNAQLWGSCRCGTSGIEWCGVRCSSSRSGALLLYAEAILPPGSQVRCRNCGSSCSRAAGSSVYATTFEGALAALFGGASTATAVTPVVRPRPPAAPPPARRAGDAAIDVDALIAEASRNLAEYQRLTAEGKLGEAGQKLEQLKRALDQLAARPR